MKAAETVLWSATAMAIIVSASLWFAQRNQGSVADRRVPEQENVTADFELTDPTGTTRTDENFRGRWMLVFFGFTNCLDVCPLGLSTIAQVMDDLGVEGAAVQPVFITVDPERDTAAAMADYLTQFGPGILGLIGSPRQIERIARALNIYHQEIDEPSASDGYTVAHTSLFFLFDPQGAFVRI